MKSKGIKFGALLAIMLIVSMAFVPAVSAQSDIGAKVIETSGTKTIFDINGMEITLDNHPDLVYNISSNQYIYLPECGRVNGPATVLYWQALHTFGYDENIKVKVKYDSADSFSCYAYDHEQKIISGLPAWDDDSFSVTVS